jgi:hypothetical protein
MPETECPMRSGSYACANPSTTRSTVGEKGCGGRYEARRRAVLTALIAIGIGMRQRERIAAGNLWPASMPKFKFAPDSPLEQSGFEPSVPLAMGIVSQRVLSPA